VQFSEGEVVMAKSYGRGENRWRREIPNISNGVM